LRLEANQEGRVKLVIAAEPGRLRDALQAFASFGRRFNQIVITMMTYAEDVTGIELPAAYPGPARAGAKRDHRTELELGATNCSGRREAR
jgi:hypothetical protein